MHPTRPPVEIHVSFNNTSNKASFKGMGYLLKAFSCSTTSENWGVGFWEITMDLIPSTVSHAAIEMFLEETSHYL